MKLVYSFQLHPFLSSYGRERLTVVSIWWQSCSFLLKVCWLVCLKAKQPDGELLIIGRGWENDTPVKNYKKEQKYAYKYGDTNGDFNLVLPK